MPLPQPPRPASILLGLWLTRIGTLVVLVFLLLPIVAIMPLSFSAGEFLTYPIPGFSLRWYRELIESDRWLPALRNSLIIGSATTVLATLLGTLAAFGLKRATFPGKGLVTGVLLLPMVVPSIIVAVGVYFFFAPLHLANSFLGLILAHTMLAAPFVVVTVSATLAHLDPSMARAAASLGAPPLTGFFRVTLPLIAPGVASGGLFAFATSFDEVVVALMIAGPGQRTLPREMFSGLRESISPTITAVATVLILTAVVLLGCLEILRRTNERYTGQRER